MKTRHPVRTDLEDIGAYHDPSGMIVSQRYEATGGTAHGANVRIFPGSAAVGREYSIHKVLSQDRLDRRGQARSAAGRLAEWRRRNEVPPR